MEENVSGCLQCGKPLKSGRTDKKFCNDGCRNAYHNAEKAAENEEIKKVENALRNNRRILRHLLGDKPSETITREGLLKQGFEFDYHTHFVISHYQHNQYTFCYNYGYRPLKEGGYKIIRSFKK